jgi:hypothetical protein
VAGKKIMENRADIRDSLCFEASRHREKAQEEFERLLIFIAKE